MRVAVVVLAVISRVASASPPGLTEVTPPGLTPPGGELTPPPVPPRVESYRAQTLVADGIAAGLMITAFDVDNDSSAALAKLSIITYVFGAPLVHLTKDRGRRALGSITMRIGLPIVGGMLGHAMAAKPTCEAYYDSCETELYTEELAYGVLAGVIAASALDAIYLAKGDPPAKPQAAWTPVARATQNGFALGVSGTF